MVTYNEEKRLPKTLEAISKVADEIVIVDSGSTDKTEEIAKRYGAKFIFHKWVSYANQKNFAQNQCQYDWLLSLDADEVLSPELIKEIKELKKMTPEYKIYNLKIADLFPGMRYKCGTRTYNIIRLYHRDYATMKAHLLSEDRIAPTQKVSIGELKAPVYHYSFLNISQHILKLNKYTDEVQQVVQKKHKHYSTIRLIFEFLLQFCHYYFMKRFCIHGTFGFIASMNLGYARFLKIAKAIENEKNKEK